MCPRYLHFLGTIRLKGKTLGGFALIGLYTVQIQWLQFPVLPLDLSFALLLPLNVSLSPSQYRAGLGYQVGGIAIVFFHMGGMTLINFCFFF